MAYQEVAPSPLTVSAHGTDVVLPTHMYRADIDGLRAVAVLSVVGFHAFPSIVKGGFIGVDIFFVISGFLITGIILGNLKAETFTFSDFYARRVKRIFPALAVVLIATLGFGIHELLPEDLRQLGWHLIGGVGFVSNFFLWQESGYFDTASITKPLLHLWSLGIEEQFYILWPIILCVAYKYKRDLLTITVVIGLASFLLNIAEIKASPTATFYSPLSRSWELMVGAVLAQTPTQRAALSAVWSNVLSIIGAVCIAVGLIFLSGASQFPGFWALSPTIGTALIVAAGPQAWINKYFLSSRIFLTIGVISFPLYLWHWPLLSYAHIIENGAPSDWQRTLAAAAAVVLAWVTYQYVERPLRLERTTRKRTILLALIMAAIGAIGLSLYVGNGLPQRFPKEIRPFAAFRFEYKKPWREGTCFLTPRQNFTAFSGCQPVGSSRGSTVYLWGDSHGAAIFSGFVSTYGSTNTLIQRTASACAPLLGVEIQTRPNCKEINDFVFESIKKHVPDEVILAANWSGYDWVKVADTIRALRSVGVHKILLIGPLPQWLGPLKKEMYAYYQQFPQNGLPSRMSYGLNSYIPIVDKQMAALAQSLSVPYFSPVGVLCNAEGCLTRVDASPGSLTYFDSGHITSRGANYLVSRIAKERPDSDRSK